MIRKLIVAAFALLVLGVGSAQAQRSGSSSGWTKLSSKAVDLRRGRAVFNLRGAGRKLRAIRFRSKRRNLTLSAVTVHFAGGRQLRSRRRVVLSANRYGGTIRLNNSAAAVKRVTVSYSRSRQGPRWQSLELWGLPALARPAASPKIALPVAKPKAPGRAQTSTAQKSLAARQRREAQRQEAARRRAEAARARAERRRLQIARQRAQTQARRRTDAPKTAKRARPSQPVPRSYNSTTRRYPRPDTTYRYETRRSYTRRNEGSRRNGGARRNESGGSGNNRGIAAAPRPPAASNGGSKKSAAAKPKAKPSPGPTTTFNYRVPGNGSPGGGSSNSGGGTGIMRSPSKGGGLPSSGSGQPAGESTGSSPPAFGGSRSVRPPAAAAPPPPPVIAERPAPSPSGAQPAPPRAEMRTEEESDDEAGETATTERLPRTAALEEKKPAAHPLSTDDYDVMTIFYGTDRKDDKPKKTTPVFGSYRAEKLQLGYAYVTVPKSHTMPNVERPWSISIPLVGTIQLGWEDPKKHFTVKELRRMKEAAFIKKVKEQLQKSKNYKDQALIFVHGFNNSFDGALYRTAQIAFDLKFDGAPFVYSWPSAGNWTSYLYDRDSAAAARPYLKEFLQLVSQKSGAKSVSIIAHSMGTYALLNVLRDLKYTAPKSVKINQIILAAPDIGINEFKILAEEIKGLSSGVTLYASANDRALDVSKNAHGGVPRAGDVTEAGPIIVSGVDSIDVSQISIAALATNHSTYAQTTELMTDIERLLKEGTRPPQKRQPILETLIGRDAGGNPRLLSDGSQATYWRFPPPKP